MASNKAIHPDSKINERLTKFFSNSPSPILFAGAGVSIKAGLPSWPQYVGGLADSVEEYEPSICTLMRERITEGDLLSAADFFFASNKVPAGEKMSMLNKPFLEPDSSRLEMLASLPFSAFVTTNYDRALLNAYAAKMALAAPEVNLWDPTLRGAPFNRGFYVARIHGRVEVPDTIVLSKRHFDAVLSDDAYLNFLRHLFTRTQVLFIGFSFSDPAIEHVLKGIKKVVGDIHYGRHLALLPSEGAKELRSNLASNNIEVLQYEATESHDRLWQIIETVATQNIPSNSEPSITPKSFSTVHRYLATTYARTSLGDQSKPLRLAVAEAIVVNHLRKKGEKGTNEKEISQYVQTELNVRDRDAGTIVRTALRRLQEDSFIQTDPADSYRISWKEPTESAEDPLKLLVDGVIDRYIVRSGGVDTDEAREYVEDALEFIITRRGWDLGAAFATNVPPKEFDVEAALTAREENDTDSRFFDVKNIGSAIFDLLRNPNSEQSIILTNLGRMAFALELAFQSPNDSVFHSATLPQRIYLDANVLLPAIVPGHLYYDVYASTISRLVDAAAKSMTSVEVVAAKGFLNEVVSHRKLAIREYESYGPDYKEIIRKQVTMYGSVNNNVFLGAYANKLKSDKELTFLSFLSQFAPYKSEKELEKHLSEMKINVVSKMDLLVGAKSSAEILHHLEKEFAVAMIRQRGSSQVEHDATQLAALDRDIDVGRRSIFVSADLKLRSIVAQSEWAYLGNAMVSNIGLVQLIELLVGVEKGNRGYAGMYWGGLVSSEAAQIRNYLTDIALEHYDDALAMEMHNVLDRTTRDIEESARDEGISLNPSDSAQRAKLRNFMGGFEDIYYREMRKLIEEKTIGD